MQIFKEHNIDTNKIKALIISHAHLDHYGSIELIQPYVNEIYMTKDTYNIINTVCKENLIDKNKVILKRDCDEFNIDNFKIKFLSNNHIKGSVAISIEIENRKILYTGDFSFKRDCDEFNIDNFKIKFLSNNHIKGSVAISIEIENRKILYTGDFSFNRQSTTKYIDEKDFYEFKNVDYLIMETTYGNKDIEIPYRYKKKLFNYFINLSVKNNVKVLIPAFAIGRAQECYDLIRNSTIKANILIDGLAIKINDYYASNERKSEIESNKYNKDNDISSKYNSNDIIIASGGVLNEGSASEKYYNIALKDVKMVTVLKCGYMDNEIYDTKIKPYDGMDINLIDISLSAHATYEDLLKLVNTIKPKNLIQVHGNGMKLYNDISSK